jgi:hypothetical protein
MTSAATQHPPGHTIGERRALPPCLRPVGLNGASLGMLGEYLTSFAGTNVLDPSDKPGALVAHAGICAGGEEQSSSTATVRPAASPNHRLNERAEPLFRAHVMEAKRPRQCE